MRHALRCLATGTLVSTALTTLLGSCIHVQQPASLGPLDTISLNSQDAAAGLVERAALALELEAFERTGSLEVDSLGTSTYTGDWNASTATQHFDLEGRLIFAPRWSAVRRELSSNHRERDRTTESRDVLAGARAARWTLPEDGGAAELSADDDPELARELSELLPQQVVREALLRRASLRRLGPEAVEGRWGEAVSYATADGRVRTLVIEPESALPLRLEDALSNPEFGDSTRAIDWLDYRREGKLVVPLTRIAWERRATSSWREELALSGWRTASRAERSAFEPPEALGLEGWRVLPAPERDPAPDALELAPGLTLLAFPDLDAQVLVAEQPDELIVVEAPGGSAGSERVLAVVRRLVPGKPVRTVVVSHHHLNYVGGVRTYIAAGARVVATEDTASVVRELVSWPFRGAPDRLALTPTEELGPHGPEIVVVRDRLVLGEGPAQLLVVRIADTGHTDEYLVTYAPAADVLFVGDLVAFGEDGEPAHFGAWARGLLAGLRTAQLTPERIAQCWPLAHRARWGSWEALLEAERAP